MDAKRSRLILNDDGSNFLYSCDDVSAEDLRAYIERLRGTQVDMVAYCVAFGGYVTYYDSEVAEQIGTGFRLTESVKERRSGHNLARLRDEAGGYLSLVFATLQEMGIPALASFRMNDAHMSSDPMGPVAGRFWMNHPEWRLGEPYGYYGSCLDYAVPAVREYLRRLILEVLEKFPDIAGIELDAMRSPFFFRDGAGREQAPIMTEFMAQVRADLDRIAARLGRERYLLRVNVPRSPELSLESGLDVRAWGEAALVDGISPGCYNTDFQLPIAEWKGLLGDLMQVQAYVNCGPGTAQYMSLEDYRGAAANAWGAGADGIYLFNFPCLDELASLLPRDVGARPFPTADFHAQCWHADLTESRRALHELGDPEAMARASKRFLFHMEPPRYRHEVQETAIIERLRAEPAEVLWHCYEDFEQAAEIQAEVKLVGITLRDDFTFELNGQPISPDRIRRVHAAGGRDARLHPAPLDPYSQYTLDLDPSALRRGPNRLTVTLTAQEPDLLGRIEVRELKVTVSYP